jgi:hypothetical protein
VTQDLHRIDRAKDLVNERVLSLLGGEHDGHANTAPLFIGLPITHHEGAWLAEITVRETVEKLDHGMPVADVLQGAFEWMLIVGIIAGEAGDGSETRGAQ